MLKATVLYLTDFKRQDEVRHVLGSVLLEETPSFAQVHGAQGHGVVWEEGPITDGGARSIVEQIFLRACTRKEQ